MAKLEYAHEVRFCGVKKRPSLTNNHKFTVYSCAP